MAETQAPRRFYRTAKDKKIAGVCGGVAKYLGMDPTLVRVLWILLTIVSFGVGLLAYVIFWAAAPEE